jgi:cytoskeleton protein RodZ
LASRICRTLKIDPAPVLAALPAATKPVLLSVSEFGMQAGSQPINRVLQISALRRLSRPVVFFGGVVVVGALSIWFTPGVGDLGLKAAYDEEIRGAVASSVSAPVWSASAAAGSPEVGASASSPALMAANGLPPEFASNTADQRALSAGPTVEAAVLTQPGIVQFNAKGDSWVEVTDANGTVQLRKTLAMGDSVQVAGASPLKVVIGRADATSVMVRGVPFGLFSVTRDNVARFEVR